LVIPASAGIQFGSEFQVNNWMPAFAGMTTEIFFRSEE
jgi:hypothetical protein